MKAKHILMIAAVLLLDQLSKWGVQTSMQIDESFDVIPGFFRITYLHNTGAAWSMLEGKMVFFYLISIVFLIGMLYFYRTTDHRDRLTRIGVVLMMAGTLGNFIDRLIFQYVRDFLVFNVADISLCVGVGLIVLSMVLETYGGRRICAK